MLLAFLTLSTLAAILIHRTTGRISGLGVTAFGALASAYFLMVPTYSLRIAKTNDLAALAAYGTVGIAAAVTGEFKRSRKATRRTGEPPQPKADLSQTVRTLVSSSLDRRLNSLDFSSPVIPLGVPCSPGDLTAVLSDVMKAALLNTEVKRLSIHGSRQPGAACISVAAHLVWPPPSDRVIVTRKVAWDCAQMQSPAWPLNARVSYFDNGYGRIFQISIYSAKDKDAASFPDLITA